MDKNLAKFKNNSVVVKIMLDPILEQKMDVIAEQIFGTIQDSDQIPIAKESGDKLNTLTPHWIKYKTDEKGDPIAWVIVLPTTKEMMHKFLKGEITEKQLLEFTAPQEAYSAIYLCAAITISQYRRQGLAFSLFEEAIEKISKTEDYAIFVWPVGDGGLELAKKVGEYFNKDALVKK